MNMAVCAYQSQNLAQNLQNLALLNDCGMAKFRSPGLGQNLIKSGNMPDKPIFFLIYKT